MAYTEIDYLRDQASNNDNEEELTEERLVIWGEIIKDEFGI